MASPCLTLSNPLKTVKRVSEIMTCLLENALEHFSLNTNIYKVTGRGGVLLSLMVGIYLQYK